MVLPIRRRRYNSIIELWRFNGVELNKVTTEQNPNRPSYHQSVLSMPFEDRPLSAPYKVHYSPGLLGEASLLIENHIAP